MQLCARSRFRIVIVIVLLPALALGLLFFWFGRYHVEAAALTVTSTVDPGDGVCDADCTLCEAIEAANDAPGPDTISFALPDHSVITLSGSVLPLITETLTIDGSTAASLTISGDYTS
jgi:CSLREA domain-containing protein